MSSRRWTSHANLIPLDTVAPAWLGYWQEAELPVKCKGCSEGARAHAMAKSRPTPNPLPLLQARLGDQTSLAQIRLPAASTVSLSFLSTRPGSKECLQKTTEAAVPHS